VRLEQRTRHWRESEILAGPRIGITKAAELPWRFWVDGDVNVAGPRGSRSAGRASGAAIGTGRGGAAAGISRSG
jgi:hypothetical protein